MENKPQQYSGIITNKTQLTKTVFHFFIRNEDPKELNFQPGQYATFIINSQTRRQYSFCSAPNSSSFELIVDVSPMGLGSHYFIEKKEGDRVEYLAPFGNFTLSRNSLKKVFVATGTGIAPFRSMILEEIKKLGDLKISKSSNLPISFPISLYWGLRYEDDMYWNMEMKSLVGQLTGSQYFLSLSKPSSKWKGLSGHVTDYVFKNSPSASPFAKASEDKKASGDKEKNLQNSEFYLCGNNAMITEMKNRLSVQNVKNKRIKIDLFY